MDVDDQFMEGFQFALFVLGSMVNIPNRETIAAQLKSVAQGELTLFPSPTEAIQSIESEAEITLPESLKQSVHRLLGNRRELDREHRRTCLAVLRWMGYGEDELPTISA